MVQLRGESLDFGYILKRAETIYRQGLDIGCERKLSQEQQGFKFE